LDTFEQKALVGKGLTVTGDLTSAEDLSIRGVVDGNTMAPNHVVTIHRKGRIKGHIFGRKIVVEGKVRGNLYADEQAFLKSSADVRGKIFASRVVLQEGSRYKGRINMDASARAVAAARTKALRKGQEKAVDASFSL